MAISDDTRSGVISSAGKVTVKISTPNLNATWTVSQVTVEYPTAPIGCTCDLRKNGSLITPLIPTGDAAGGDPPIVLRGNDSMTINFAGGTSGEVVNVFFVYDDGRDS